MLRPAATQAVVSVLVALVPALALAQAGDQLQASSAGDREQVEEEQAPDSAAYLANYLSRKDPNECLRSVDLVRPKLPGQAAPDGDASAPRPRRLVLAIDSSGSMRAVISGERKLDAARRAAAEFLDATPPDVEVGLVVFGHKGDSSKGGKAASCAGVETLYPVGPANRPAIEAALAGLRATGWTPLAGAIDHAGGMFAPSEVAGEQVLYVVSDGLETCGGDPVAAARRL